ncbi:DUF1003 domain-containing protein [Clostridium sp.]|jgi:uncharacterized membrane protein|uniref:DUF1003 domain-containing protein n=1 Tax=Clostridium sp. TaxID=1506 RepID=UPI002583FC53|nr:DUF1003 domain-containing protein [Clostridium sp.]MDF2505216.1 putative rane protein [Clostridium sp.]
MSDKINKEKLVKKILDNDRDLDGSNISEELIHELISGKISKNINNIHDEKLTIGQKVADKIASFGGSWPFIISFVTVLVVWIVVNAVLLSRKAFDPYPFILLNLALSCVAAIQAPIIMMSQNRESEKDRLTAANDYLVNLKSEIIIEDLHKKIDILMEQQEENKKNIELLLKAKK